MIEPHKSPLTLLVVDDHEVVRQGLSSMLDRRPGFQVVAEAGTVAESIEMARRFQPDLVIMDVRLPTAPASKPVARFARSSRTRASSC